MRILVWNSWVTPAGGMERVALSIANGLADVPGNKVVLTGPYQTVPLLQQRIQPNVTFAPCEFIRRPDGMLQNWWHLRRLVREHNIDIISAHGSLLPLLPLAQPVVWTEHGPRYGNEKILQGSRAVTWGAIRRRLQSGHWKLLGCSNFVRDYICRELQLDPRQAAVVLNGLPNPERFDVVPPPRFRPPFRIGLLGRVEHEKHPFDIFELDKMLAARGMQQEWHIFGEGSLLQPMRERAAQQNNVHVHGLAANPAEAFAQMDVLVFLSHGEMEGLPTVILEARQARRPVVAWNVTANPEAAGPHDILVEPFKLPAFAAALQRVFERAEVPPPVGDLFSYGRMVQGYQRVMEQHLAEVQRGFARAGGAA